MLSLRSDIEALKVVAYHALKVAAQDSVATGGRHKAPPVLAAAKRLTEQALAAHGWVKRGLQDQPSRFRNETPGRRNTPRRALFPCVFP